MRLSGLADAYLLNQAAQDVRHAMRGGAEPAEVLRAVKAEIGAARRRFLGEIEAAVKPVFREVATGDAVGRSDINLGGLATVPNRAEPHPGDDWVFTLMPSHREAIKRRVLQLMDAGVTPNDLILQVQGDAGASAEIAGAALVEHAEAVIAEELKARQFIANNQVGSVLRVRGLGFGK